MKRFSAIIFILFVAATAVTAQYAQKKLSAKPKFIDFADNPKPGLHSVPPEYMNESVYIIQDDVSLDYKEEGRDLNAYYVTHTIWKVLDVGGVEESSSIRLRVDGQTRFQYIRARTISPNGHVQEVPQSMIKVTADGGGRIIAIAPEGLEKNSEVELLLKEIIPGGTFGSRYFQYTVPVQSARWDVSYPREYVFEAKGYNGLPDMQDVLMGNRRHMRIEVSNVPALKPELFSFWELHLMRAEYKLHHYDMVNYNDRSEVNTWDKLGRVLFDEYYKISQKERAAVNKYLTDLGVRSGGKEEDNIRKIENGIKNSIVLYDYVQGDSTEQLDSIIAKKQATHDGYIKLFAACFTQALVSHELGKACDKSERQVRKDVENWHSLDYTLFYFPKQQKFLYPLGESYRYPVVPAAIAGGKGVFCLIPPKGIVTGMLAEVRRITPLSANETQRNIAAGVTFNDDMEATVDVSYSFTGYAAAGIRNDLREETKEDEKDIVKNVVAFAETREDIQKYYISNDQPESYNENKPLVITASVAAPFLTGKAGQKYVFSIGELIGAQPSLYDKAERKLPVDMSYPVTLNRSITVNIPKGHKVVNPEVLKKNAEFVNRDLKTLCSFSSDYVLITDKKNGDKLVVTVKESYPVTHFAVTDFERFREVINASYDFSRTSILLERKPGYVKPKTVAKN
ncbi:MAG: hypothetical protein K0Q79_3213 [Flavipsychrobacter sp.]|jgi:hypothetical protein|nr:hypothetical protein [Flavipsychrobacter sp.]